MEEDTNDNDSGKQKTKKEIHPFLETLGRMYPTEYLTKPGKVPRCFKGDYCCQLFSKVRLGMAKSQLVRTRTVTTGFKSVATRKNMDTFLETIDLAVDHLSRVSIMASLFANFAFMKACENDTGLPEPDESFYLGCLSACTEGSGGGDLNTIFDRFSSLTGLSRQTRPDNPI